MTIPVLDARDVYCPELFLVMRRFINSRPDEKFIQVNTKEERARNRLEHFCSEIFYVLARKGSFRWVLFCSRKKYWSELKSKK